ncbi:MAG: ACT domain-containing protein [Planctomycetota bacterium]
MAFEITRVDVWVGDIEDRPGALATKLEALMRAGADLDFIIVRPTAGTPGMGVLFVAPLRGPEQLRAAGEVGVQKSATMHVLRIAGPDRPGQAAGIARILAEAGLNMSGLSAAAINEGCLFYIRFDAEEDAKRAAQILTAKLG